MSEYSESQSKAVLEVMKIHQATFPDVFVNPVKLTSERNEIIGARLDTFTCDQLCLAVMNSRMFMQRGGKSEADFFSPETIFATDENVRDLLAENI
ncbi:MAG: hypothetical protein JKX97_05230 [Candidatus Lindowbacteria bacterium]|nr:hypothetical protein [Candidatus Lindowbacteria bacterium]